MSKSQEKNVSDQSTLNSSHKENMKAQKGKNVQELNIATKNNNKEEEEEEETTSVAAWESPSSHQCGGFTSYWRKIEYEKPEHEAISGLYQQI